ncbi:MAG: hypothetical protein QM817_32795 [Archangium sp.]
MAFEAAWQHIRTNPRDIDARRVLADAFLAEGNDQGELLRLCQVPKSERANVKPRVTELLNANVQRWYPRPPWYESNWSWCHPDSLLETGGVPDAFSLPAKPEHLAWWLERYPLRQLWMSSTASPEMLAALVDGGHFERLEFLLLDAQHTPSVLPQFLERIGPGLQKLQITSTVDAGRTLAAGRWLHELRSLSISLREPSVLAKLWPELHALEQLHVNSYGLGEKALASLAVRSLRSVSVRVQRTSGPEGSTFVTPLLAACEPAALETLSLSGCELEDEHLVAFVARVKAEGLPAMEQLALPDNRFRGLPALLTVPMPKLNELDVTSNKLSEYGLRALVQQPFMKHVKRLGLVRNEVITGHDPVYDYGIEVASTPIEATAEELRAMLSIPSSIHVF